MFTAKVSGTGNTPTGTVTFKAGGVTLGTVTLNGGVAKVTTSTLHVGTVNVSAQYSATNDFLGSSATVSQVVNK